MLRRMRVFTLSALTAVLAASAVGYHGYTAVAQTAQAARFDAAALIKGYDTYRQMRQASPTASVPWQYLGPTNVSGRATDVAVADRNGRRSIIVGYATSGVWKSDDNGATWSAIFEHMPSTSIGDVAIAPSNPDIVWVGTGEANLFRASLAGVGIYKSTDGGKTFQHMGLHETHTIARIVVHPTNPDLVYVAATGHGWTDNAERGVFKTTNGGRTWTKVFYKSDRTGANDLVMDPANPEVLYASLWQRIRRKWSDPRVEPGYREGGIIKTTDGGKTWTDASAGLPAPEFRGRIGIDIARSSPNTLYAFVDNYEIGRDPQPNERDAYGRPIANPRIKGAQIYRTDDRGATWRRVNEADLINHSQTYGWVFGQIRVDPTNPDLVYTMGINLNRSTDGGRTIHEMPGTNGVHGDHHGLWIDPANPLKMYNANDGGFYHTEDGGKTWKFAVAAAGAQFYNVALDNSTPIWAYGSIQDHGSRRGQVILSNGRDRIPALAWEGAPGGEGSHHAIDPNNSIIYSHGFYGNFSRTDLEEQRKAREAAAAAAEAAKKAGQTPPPAGRGRGRGNVGVTNIQPMRDDPEAELRAQWMAPIVVSRHDGSVIYAGYQYLFRSANRGDSWQKISPDLTAGDQEQMLPKHSSAIPYQTIVSIAESPKSAAVLYVGTDDGKLHMTMDMGKTWTELTSRLPVRNRWISRVVVSQHADNTIYVTQQGRSDDDFAPYIWKSADGGKTFTSIVNNIPAGPVNVIREAPRDPNTLYVGTDHGVYVSRDGGTRWNVLGGGLPSVQVSDLQVHGRDTIIVVSTYGRGMWAFDLEKVR